MWVRVGARTVESKYTTSSSETGRLGGLRHVVSSVICSARRVSVGAVHEGRCSVGGEAFGQNDDRGKRVGRREMIFLANSPLFTSP